MRRLNLKNPNNQELIELLKYGTGLKVNNVPNEASIEEIFYNKNGNYIINAMISVMERKIIKRTSQEVDSEMNCEIIKSVTWQQATVLAYFSKKNNRVEKSVTLPGVTFIPVKGSNMLGILVSEDVCMMTCNIGENININNSISFQDVGDQKLAVLSFKWEPEYSIHELESDPKKIDAIIRCGEKLNPVYSQIKRFFYLVVDKDVKPVGQIYDSTMGKYLPVTSLVIEDFEKEFFARAVVQAKEDKKQEVERRDYLICLGDNRILLIGK